MGKQANEKIGLIPRSIIRTLDRFSKQLRPETKNLAMQEFRVSRQQMRVSISCFLTLFIVPFLVNIFSKQILIEPLTEYFWNSLQEQVFLNSYQTRRAVHEMQDFKDIFLFESLLDGGGVPTVGSGGREAQAFSHSNLTSFNICACACAGKNVQNLFAPARSAQLMNEARNGEQFLSTNPTVTSLQPDGTGNFSGVKPASLQKNEPNNTTKIQVAEEYNQLLTFRAPPCFPGSELDCLNESLRVLNENCFPGNFPQGIQIKINQLARTYNQQSIQAITNLVGDLITLATIRFLFISMKPQIFILKSFLTESLYSLSDTNKSFVLILITDLLVGYHSPKGWEVLTEIALQHYGFPEARTFILVFIGTFPVFLDTIFKYWIFRHLNRISPSTVVTYHSMIE
jgi:hypothetical protein